MKIPFPSEFKSVALSGFPAFAIASHGEQKYGEFPYGFHLQHVWQTLAKFTDDSDILLSAWGHDLIEDTGVTRVIIADASNENVAKQCWAVTGEGKNREERLQSVVLKIPTVPGSEILKMGDRCCNVLQSLETGNERLMGIYVREHPVISAVFPSADPLRYYLESLIEEARADLASRKHLKSPAPR